MSDELDRRLAARFITEHLKKEYATDPVVNACLQHARRGDCSIEVALVECIKLLVEQKNKLMKDLMDREWERPQIINMADGRVLKYDPVQVREEREKGDVSGKGNTDERISTNDAQGS